MPKTINVVDSVSLLDEAFMTIRPYIEIGKIAQVSKPTIVARGVSKGYSLPIFNSDDEEIFMCTCVPRKWNGTSNPIFCLPCYIDTINSSKNFNIQVSWEHYAPDTDILASTSNDVEIQQATGVSAAQYQSYLLEFPFDYDIDGAGNELQSYERMCARVRRIAASVDEIAGEVVLGPPVVKFKRNTA